jgi:cell division GTPase FtsZ
VVQAVLANPLYNYTIEGADRILFNVTGDRNLKMQEVAYVSSSISQYNQKARIIFGIACNSRLKERLKVTLFAVGCEEAERKREVSSALQARRSRKKRKKLLIPKVVLEEQGKQKKVQPIRLEKGAKQEVPQPPVVPKTRVRRNALDVKKAVDEELKELEQKEKQWDIPAFLRNKS